uniref:Uncharacterized protein n=2 Tax=Candidatus Kentrum sp. SD TaxID=2126332 RepID=A0A450YST8_9GAMM|nr:MAG: hypothetical protein BECKSD772F_GA0070984_11853 [Candidatus Kentron sp. SD]VFK49514.1 MAG: hypothetical protein BECKSD772E_GA0070983_11853 [Candidatus Kentron sp. SD]
MFLLRFAEVRDRSRIQDRKAPWFCIAMQSWLRGSRHSSHPSIRRWRARQRRLLQLQQMYRKNKVSEGLSKQGNRLSNEGDYYQQRKTEAGN